MSSRFRTKQVLNKIKSTHVVYIIIGRTIELWALDGLVNI